MARCEVCGNTYDKSFVITMAGVEHTFDAFECAIHALAPSCDHCGCRIIGHGVEEQGDLVRIVWHHSSSNEQRTFQISYEMTGLAVAYDDVVDVNLQVAGNTLNIRAELPEDKGGNATRYEQTVTLPQFLDIDKLTASHYHGMLRLSLPLKEAVKPRRVQIQTEGAGTETRQLAGSASGGR